jgi:hypothetical protein
MKTANAKTSVIPPKTPNTSCTQSSFLGSFASGPCGSSILRLRYH